MNSKNSTNKPPKKARKILLLAVVSLISFLLLAHFIWVSTGSNQWKLIKDENGIKIWTIKTPGNSMIKCKANFRVQSTLAGIVKLIEDTSSWADLGMDNKKITLMDPIHAPGYYSAYLGFKQNMPFPFTDREIITLMQRFQNPQNKKIEINVMAAPNKLPPIKGYVRIEHMHNNYTYTPLKNGEVDVDFRNEFDLGGSVPYVIKNWGAPAFLYKMMVDFKRVMKMDKYKNAKLDDIKEFNEN
jgi:hypothetical protein